MQYEEIVSYIADIPKFTTKHPLEHTQEFIRRLGNPCHDRKVIHVAGTNGKGSVCAFMQAILLCEGKHVGLFTSPHLVKINERIQIDGVPVIDEAFSAGFERVKGVVDKMAEEGIPHPSYFEFLYGIGMVIFEAEEVEYLILETGLGGRLDATNSFEHPIMTVITSIGMDHMGILGNTIEEIAKEKAGIIKEGIPLCYDGTSDVASEVIRMTAEKKHAPCRKIGKDAFEIREITDKQVAFSIVNGYDKNIIWTVASTGIYQMMNATLAVSAMEEVLGKPSDTRKWKRALERAKWPGRMEEVLPGVILDGAHNLPAIERFCESLRKQKEYFAEKGEQSGKTVILFSAVDDKDYEQMIHTLCSEQSVDSYVVTKLTDKRGASMEVLTDIFQVYTDKPVYTEDTLEAAFHKAMEEKGADGRLYCLGSLYLIGELKGLIGEGYAEF